MFRSLWGQRTVLKHRMWCLPEKKRKYCQDLNIIKKSQTCILLLSYCIIRTLSGWYWFQHCPDTSFGLECENDQTLHQDVLGSKLPPTSRFQSVRSYVWSFNWTVDISFSRASGNLLVVEESQPNTSPLSTWPQRDLGFSILYLFRKKNQHTMLFMTSWHWIVKSTLK